MKATFGAGCFWGVEALFRQVPGVTDVAVGYAGGNTKNPTYKEVCEGDTNHAEVVDIDFDPTQVAYEKLLELFWANHDPTTPNRQGPDWGTQYRSVVFCHDDAQWEAAEAMRAKLDASGKFRGPIVTEISPVQPFWRAEEYHQRYLEKRGQASCHL